MVQIRKIVFIRELITSDAFGEPCEPVSRVAAAAVFRNPLAGRFQADLSVLFEIGAELGLKLAEEAVAQLIGHPVDSIHNSQQFESHIYPYGLFSGYFQVDVCQGSDILCDHIL